MLMTETELNNLFGQVNDAFKEQSDRLKQLKQQLDQLEERLNGYEKRSKVGYEADFFVWACLRVLVRGR